MSYWRSEKKEIPSGDLEERNCSKTGNTAKVNVGEAVSYLLFRESRPRNRWVMLSRQDASVSSKIVLSFDRCVHLILEDFFHLLLKLQWNDWVMLYFCVLKMRK